MRAVVITRRQATKGLLALSALLALSLPFGADARLPRGFATASGGSLVVTTSSLSACTTWNPQCYNTITATGATPPCTWSISSASPDTNNWMGIIPNSPTSGTTCTALLYGVPGFTETETGVVISATDSASHTANSSSLSLTINAAGTNTTPTPTLLPFVSACSPLSGGSLTTFLTTARATAAGGSWSDACTSVPVVRVTDGSTPVASNTGYAVQYSTMGLQISGPWGVSSNQYTLAFFNQAGQGYVVDYTLSSGAGPGVGTLSNYRTMPGPSQQIAMSRMTPQIMYYVSGSTMHRYSTATNANADTGNYPISGVASDWFMVNQTDTWSTGIGSGNNTSQTNLATSTTAAYTGTTNGAAWTSTQEKGCLDELYIGYGSTSLVNNDGCTITSQGAFSWDLPSNTYNYVTPSLPFHGQGVSHVPSMNGYWMISNSNDGTSLTLAEVSDGTNPIVSTTEGALVRPLAAFTCGTGGVSSTTLTVSAVTASITPGEPLKATGVTYGNVLINSQLSGTVGGIGTYQLSSAATITNGTSCTAGAATPNGGAMQANFSGSDFYLDQWHESGHWSQPPSLNQWSFMTYDCVSGAANSCTVNSGRNANAQYGNILVNAGSGVAYILNYHYSNDNNSVFGGSTYWSQAHGSISNDGKIAIWNSELIGNGRLDIFLSELPRQ